MNDPDDPHADPRLDALFDAMRAGDPHREDPFSLEVERLLEGSGPIAVDGRDADAAVERLMARLGPAAARPAHPWGRIALAAAALVAVGAVASLAIRGDRAVPPDAEPVVAVAPAVDAAPIAPNPEAPPTEVALGDGTIAEIVGDTVVLVDGVVSVARTDPRQPGAHRVRVAGLDLAIEPVGTVFDVGTRGSTAAVRVREGRVRLLHDAQGHLGEIAAGSWALVTADGAGLALRRLPDGPMDPVVLGLDPGVAELLADLRWLALPPAARDAILSPDPGR